MQLMPYLVGSLKILTVILFLVTLLTYMFHALKGFGKKETATVSAADAQKLTARKEKIDEKKHYTSTRLPEQKKYNKDHKRTSSKYSSKEPKEKRYRKVKSSRRLTVINETM